MKESLIFSNINSFALIRQLAQRGINSLGIRVFNNRELLSYIWQKNALFPKERIISNKEKAYIYNRFIRESTYFKGSSYEDGKSLCETIDSIRELIEEDEDKVLKDKLLNSSSSKEKYEEIYNIYSKYIKYLNDNNLTDVIVEERKIISSNINIENEITYIKEEDITPLSLKLLNKCFKNIKEINYRDLYGVKETPITLNNLYKTKGFVHEVGNVFKIIHDNKLPLDTCTIACTKLSNFYNAIKEISLKFDIPVFFVDGVPSTEFNAYRLLYLIVKHNDNLYGYNTLKDLLNDYSFNFDKFIEAVQVKDNIDDYIRIIGDLKFSFDSKYNDQIFKNYFSSNKEFIDEVNNFKDILNRGIINFIKEYTVIDDEVVLDSLINDIDLYKSINYIVDFDYLRSLLNQNIKISSNAEGKLVVCSLLRTKEYIRDNMFFIGNDSESFHITLAENTFISDDKLLEISKDYAKTSLKLAELKKQGYSDIIEICSALGVKIYVSYTELDEVELKKHNFISILYILNKSNDQNLTFKKFKESFKQVNGYIGNELSKDEKIIESYLDKTVTIKSNEITQEENKINNLLEKKYSPTTIEEGLKCKRKFLISRILKVEDPDDYDVFRKIENYDLGNIFHLAMEFANDKTKSEDEVLKNAEELFDSLCNLRNPILKYELKRDKDDFLKLVTNGYEYLKGKKQGEVEEPLSKDLEIESSTLHIIGRPDLVVDDAIIDYKTKKHITHVENDKLSCIQALIYAIARSDKHITHVEYYYPYFKKAIKTDYTEADVKEILKSFVDILKNSDFKPAYLEYEDKKKVKEICQYCNYSDICGKDINGKQH